MTQQDPYGSRFSREQKEKILDPSPQPYAGGCQVTVVVTVELHENELNGSVENDEKLDELVVT